jgi:alkaline phosphatase D
MAGEATPDVTVDGLDPVPFRAPAAAPERAADRDAFPQSVASGGPTPEGVILWTRVSPTAWADYPDEPLVVRVAADHGFDSIVLEGAVPADRVGPEWDHAVRVDVDGALTPGREYHYRFVHGDRASPVGRCRTLPAPDADVDSVRLGVVACQDYENGYYPAFGDLADERLDFLVHTGDLIYESADRLYTGVGSDRLPDRRVELPSGKDRAWTRTDFRAIHRTYRSDRFLQAALREHTLVATWDDHAVANNVYWDREADAPVAPEHPRGRDPAFARDLARAGIRAWYEYVPARVRYDPSVEPLHDSFRLYRRVRFGRLAELLVTDARFYRDGPPEGTAHLLHLTLGLRPAGDPDRTMLGDEQADWLARSLRGTDARWAVWLTSVLAMPLRLGVGPLGAYPKQDSWDGFATERERLFRAAGDADASVVALSGDLHSAIAGTLRQETGRGEAVGVEFMTPAISSVNLAEAIGVDEGRLAGATRSLFSRAVTGASPWIDAFDSHHWGYSVVEFDREAVSYTAYAVDKSTNRDDADRRVLARFEAPHGEDAVRER